MKSSLKQAKQKWVYVIGSDLEQTGPTDVIAPFCALCDQVDFVQVYKQVYGKKNQRQLSAILPFAINAFQLLGD